MIIGGQNLQLYWSHRPFSCSRSDDVSSPMRCHVCVFQSCTGKVLTHTVTATASGQWPCPHRGSVIAKHPSGNWPWCEHAHVCTHWWNYLCVCLESAESPGCPTSRQGCRTPLLHRWLNVRMMLTNKGSLISQPRAAHWDVFTLTGNFCCSCS